VTHSHEQQVVDAESADTVASCSFYIKCSMCPPFCWMTHS